MKVLPGEYFVDDEDILIMTTLGSCIAACLWDRNAQVGGMNHFMLPEGVGDSGGRYGSYAMELLINEMLKRGATRSTLEAKVFGGGQVISGMNTMNVGERNTSFVLDYLKTERIPVVSQGRARHLPAQGLLPAGQRQGHGQAPGPANTEALLAQERAAVATRRPGRQPVAARSTCSDGTHATASMTEGQAHGQDTCGGGRRFGAGAQPAHRDHQPAARHGMRRRRGRPAAWRAR